MGIENKKEPVLLLLGDLLLFFVSLWVMLFVRYGVLPAAAVWQEHLLPFSIIFIVWVVVFFIAGLYDKHTIILKSRLPSTLLNAQIINSVVAVLFFYFIPIFGITPKVNLFIYLVISFLLILWWRLSGFSSLSRRKKQNAILVGSGEEMRELEVEVNQNPRYGIRFISSVDTNHIDGIDFYEEIIKRIYDEEVSIVAIDLRSERIDPILPHLYNLIFSKVRFIDMYKIYEDIFDRIPLSLVRYNWFLENVSVTPTITYDALKRAMDAILSFLLGILSLPLYPLVFLAIKLDDRGPIFLIQERVGKGGRTIQTFKFRSMSVVDGGGEEHITRVGAFLRKLRIDELPQLVNVLRGDLSLIGPRPELRELVKLYEKEIPYYNIRHLIKPGLSGWAQLHHEGHPHYAPDVSETKVKLSYDLYYIKNRSFLLDLTITLKTLKVLVSRSGV